MFHALCVHQLNVLLVRPLPGGSKYHILDTTYYKLHTRHYILVVFRAVGGKSVASSKKRC